MKTQLRLGSLVPHGIGTDSGVIALDMIYSYLLGEYGENVYSYIGINQIGDDMNEKILKGPANHIHINIRYPAVYDYAIRGEQEKKRIRLDIAHTALVRIALEDKKLNLTKLETIRSRILEQDFSFDLICKTYPNSLKKLMGKVIMCPDANECNYYFVVDNDCKEEFRVCIYRGLPEAAYDYRHFFGLGKWRGIDQFILTGKLGEVETKVQIQTGRVDIINLTSYAKPPYYTLMQAGISEEQRKISRSDYEQSLSPESRELLKTAALTWGDIKK